MTTEKPLVQNSAIIDVFDTILHDPRASLRAVQFVGRGIAAKARCTLSVLVDKTAPHGKSADVARIDTLAYVDQLIQLSDIEDDLVGLWRRRYMEDLEDEAFEAGLEQIVVRLEAWTPVAD
jgi:hypothetical protein